MLTASAKTLFSNEITVTDARLELQHVFLEDTIQPITGMGKNKENNNF
jgi:hypothetical protein